MTALPSHAGARHWRTHNSGTIGAWVKRPLSGWQAASNSFGPLQSARIFFHTALPAKFAGSAGSSLPAGVTLIVSYNTPDTHVSSYVCSVPPDRNVILVYYHEPENRRSPFAAGADFVTAFNAQAAEIRQAAANCGATTVKVGMIAMTWAYGNPSRRGYSCSFIPPASSVDYYLADTYEHNEQTLAADPGFQRWNACTAGPVPKGLAEYGVGLGNTTPSGCQYTDAQRASAIQADEAYLTGLQDFGVWDYSWVAFDAPCRGQYQFPLGGQSAATWQAIVTGAPLPPVISVTQPASNATVHGAVTVSGTASGRANITQVQISVDGGTPQPANGTANWTASVSTTGLADGSHTITVQATDAHGTTGTASVTVNVHNSGGTASCPAAPPAGTTSTSGHWSRCW